MHCSHFNLGSDKAACSEMHGQIKMIYSIKLSFEQFFFLLLIFYFNNYLQGKNKAGVTLGKKTQPPLSTTLLTCFESFFQFSDQLYFLLMLTCLDLMSVVQLPQSILTPFNQAYVHCQGSNISIIPTGMNVINFSNQPLPQNALTVTDAIMSFHFGR